MKKLIIAAIIAAGASVSASAASATAYWIQDGITLNARSGPSTHYEVLGKFRECTRVHVVAYKHGWAKVAYKHNYYWVSAKYLQDHKCAYGHGYKPRKIHKKHYSYGD